MLQALKGMTKKVEEMLQGIDPATLHATDAVAVLEQATALERRVVALKVLLAERAADAGTWLAQGHRSPEAWLSATGGTSYGEAAAMLEASEKLPELPKLNEAVRQGELSGPKLGQLARAATPENEGRLAGGGREGELQAVPRDLPEGEGKDAISRGGAGQT